MWGGAASAILALGALAFAIVVAQTTSPDAHVARYLEALARDDRASAARLAGLQPTAALPLGDEVEPSIRRIISVTPERDGTVTVLAEYGDEGDAERVPFSLEPAPPLLGFIPSWAFEQSPVTTLDVGSDHHDQITVGEQVVTTAAAGQTARVRVFIPARVTVRLQDPLLRAESVSVRMTTAVQTPVILAVEPSARFARSVQQHIDRLLDECATQTVLLPTGCPFGVEIDDRVINSARWQLTESPAISLTTGERAGVWLISGDGEARLMVSVQRLFDGTIDERDDRVAFAVRGEVVFQPDGPVLTVFSPEG